jgi:hypothetical protein
VNRAASEARGETARRVGYELFLIPVPRGADVEETGEALLVRLTRGHERTKLTDSGRARAESVAERLVASDPELAAADPGAETWPGVVELRASSGIVVSIADRFARFLVPFEHQGEAAAAAFRRLFSLLAVAAEATGWRLYDPQEAESVPLDDAGCASVLEIYLSVMDQLRSGPETA